MVSVLIATKNRPKHIRDCIISVCANTLRDIEVLVLDQSDTGETQRSIHAIDDTRLSYLHTAAIGKSNALNFGLSQAKGDIIAFTDDDCIVSKHWLSHIEKAFRKYPQIAAVFGQTKPYQPNKHPGKICPCVFSVSHPHIIDEPCFHARYIGFGNNMAIRKSVLDIIGGFKPWLGPGSVGSNAEDAELALRILVSGKKILLTPQIKVYHNRWLTPKQMNVQTLSYVCGEMACYGYFHFQGFSFATEVIRSNMNDTFHSLRPNKSFFYEFQKLLSRARGVCVGWYFTRMNPSFPLITKSVKK